MGSNVEDVMTQTVAVVREDTDFKEIVAKMDEYHVSALPVVDINERLTGIVTETDLLMKEEHPDLVREPHLLEMPTHRSVRKKATALKAEDVMTSPVQTVTRQARLAEVAALLHQFGVHQVVVVDRRDRIVGIVTRRDLLKVFLRSDGEIEEEITGLLERTLSIPPHTVRVRARRGVVSLEGELERAGLITVLIELVQRVDGVVSVDDRLTSQTHEESSGHMLTDPWARFNTASQVR
ncbi:MAG: CBS domain-containing protein [Actinomycetota bacterium]